MSAVGIGTLTYLIWPSVTFGAAGLLGAALVGASSLYVIPLKRRQLKVQNFKSKFVYKTFLETI